MAVTWSCVNISREEQRRRQETKASGGEGGVAEYREEFHSALAAYQTALKVAIPSQRQESLLKLCKGFPPEVEDSPLSAGYEGKLGKEEQLQVKQLLSCIYRNLATLYEQQEENPQEKEENPQEKEEKLQEKEAPQEQEGEKAQEQEENVKNGEEKDQEIETIDLNSEEGNNETHEKPIEGNKEPDQKSKDENKETQQKSNQENQQPAQKSKDRNQEPDQKSMTPTETQSKLPNSIRYYIKSLTTQGTDLQIWLQLGSLCHRRRYLHYARWSLERVTQLGAEGYRSPWKWQGLTRLIEVLYDIGDTRSCLHWIDQALQVLPDFPRGQWLRAHLTHQLNGTQASPPPKPIASPHVSRKRQFEPLTPTRPKRILVTTPIILKDRDWVSLGSELLAAYKEDLKDFKASPLSSVPQRILHVTFEAPTEVEGAMTEERAASGSGTPKPPPTKKRSLPPPSTRPARTRAGAARDDPDPSHGSTTKNMTAFYEAITELFQFKGYRPPEDHPTPLTFLAASSQGLESSIKDFALKLRNKMATEYKPIYSSSWARDYLSIRKAYASAKRGAASGILSPPIDTIDLTAGLDIFITELNAAKMVAADWLLEFLLRLFGDPVGPPGTACPWLQGRWPPSLLRVTMQILVALLPSLVPGFPFASLPLRTRFAWLIGICELVMVSKKWEAGISTKTSSHAITTLASPASVQCWLTHLETERHYWKDPMDPDLALRYWWLVASSHSQSDPKRELVALKQVADLLTRGKVTNADEDCGVNHPNCTYGTRISLELVEERRVKAEIMREKAQSTSDTEYSPQYLLPHIRVLTHRLDTGNSKESSHLTLATHILKYSTRPCFTDDQAEVTTSDRSYVHHCKLRAAMIVLEIRLCDLFSSIVEFCHLKESSVFKSTSSTLGTGVHVKPSPESYLAQIRDNFEAIALVVQGISPHLHAPVDSEMSLSQILTPAQLGTYYHLSQVLIHLIGALLKLSDTFLTHPQSMDVCQVFMVRGLEFFLQCTLKLPPLTEVAERDEEGETLDNSISEFIFLIHNEFGKFKLCEVDSGSLPRCLMTVLKQLSDTNCQEDINQCLTCLYLLPINKQPLYKEEHARQAQPLDITAATEIYHAVWEIIEPKMIKGTAVQPSYKNILDTLGQFLLQDTLTQSAVYSFNRKLIDGYLDQEMNFFTRVKDIEGPPLATIGEIGNVNLKLPKLYATLFLTLGHIQINQIQSKLHQTWTVVEADIEAMMDSFKRHLYLCPHSVEGWYFLGLSYDIYAAGLLCRSQTKSSEEYGSISTLQKKGLFCYAEAARWLHQAPSYSLSCSITLDTFWSSFGTLAYTSASKPMAMDVYEFESHQCMKLVPEATFRSGYAACPVKIPQQDMIYRFALSLFHRSLKVQPHRWEPCMMVAKCFGKLKIFPKEAILFLQQAVKYSSKNFTQDPLIEPSYQLISFLYKYRTRKLMSDDEICTALAYCQFDKVTKKSVAREDPPSPADTTTAPGEDKEEETSALSLLLQSLTHLKSLDKEWRHRLSYRMAWIQFHEYGDVKGALDEMENLVNIKKTIANFVNVWKPMLERPGKHFVYVAQYITFMYKLMVEFTPPFLATFLKRVHKINFRIYRYHQVWSQGITLYVEVSRRYHKIPHHHLLGHPWSTDGFHIATQATRRRIQQFLHPPPDTIFDVDEELRRPLYLELKAAFDLAKLPTTPPTPLPPLDLIIYLGDLYFSLLLSFQFDPTTTLPPRPNHPPLRAFHPPDLWRCLELFMRESTTLPTNPSSQPK